VTAMNRPFIFLKVLLEPGNGFRIKVVCRLIQEQHVGLLEKKPAHRDAPDFAT
jgi:hypothetical protein